MLSALLLQKHLKTGETDRLGKQLVAKQKRRGNAGCSSLNSTLTLTSTLQIPVFCVTVVGNSK